jgi:hypothetical protein
MLGSEKVLIRVNSNHLKYYRDLGYSANNLDTIYVLPRHLPHGSHVKINISCDYCNIINYIEFRSISDKINFIYSCRSCSSKASSLKYPSVFRNSELQRELSLRNDANSLIKRKKSRLTKYGDENYNNQSKRKGTLKSKYGDENYNNTDKRRETSKTIYGDSNYNNQSKKIETCKKKYGVEYTNQLESVWKKIQKSSYKTHDYKNTGIHYQGSYELDFLEYCTSNDIKISNGPSINYIFKGKKRKYYPDFIIENNNLVVEIKSTYTLNYDMECNIAKQNAVKLAGYNFIFVVDKNYKDLKEIIRV